MMPPRPPSIFAIFAIIASSIFYGLAAIPSLAAGDPKAGRKKAPECQTCHGLDGVSIVPTVNPILLAVDRESSDAAARC
jgi:cytochrome c2